ncbi:hypothetical protein RN001_012525 [Aquatica leii]|uniref:Major facilitator superfamily (MFS) profile domain-containing protein n=1 Tax=Aquatica leii TaxID=1421715 RepID=A0AAN7SMH5_9COLE|nr:hypothetical protein RN001_012525 [Aquatica leii]
MYEHRYQILATLSATVSEVSDGMQYGWSAPITPKLMSPNSPVEFKESQIVWVETSLLLGTMVGIPITIFLLENFGRRNSILAATVQNLLAWILIAFSNSVGVVYAARFISGISASVVFAAAPVYAAEIAHKNIRGFLGSFFSMMMMGGILMVYCVAPFVSIPASSAVGAFFLIVQLLTFPFMPESPYYHLITGNKDKARRSLQRLRATIDVEEELEELSEAVSRQESEKQGFSDLITVKSNRQALLIMLVLNCAQHLCGISVMLMNLHSILKDAASVMLPSTVAILFSVIMWIAALVGSYSIDRYGRKITLIISCILTGIALLGLAIYFTVQSEGIDVSKCNWIPVVLVLIYAGAFRFGLGLIPIILTAELFPTNVKSAGVTISEAFFTTFSCITVFSYPFLTKAFGLKMPFFTFSICCFLTCIFVIFCIPETKGKSLEEIQHILRNGRNSYKSFGSYGSITSINSEISRQRHWS